MWKNLANIITISRGALTILIVLIWLTEWENKYFSVFVIFWLAALSDFFDGWLARRLNVVSPLGSVLDPLFDKILTFTMFLLVFGFHIIPDWVIIVLFLRDLIIDALRNYLFSRGTAMPAILAAKLKTNFQILMINFILMALVWPYWPYVRSLALWCGVLAATFSLWSGAVYVYRASRSA